MKTPQKDGPLGGSMCFPGPPPGAWGCFFHFLTPILLLFSYTFQKLWGEGLQTDKVNDNDFAKHLFIPQSLLSFCSIANLVMSCSSSQVLLCYQKENWKENVKQHVIPYALNIASFVHESTLL